jgi:hypothetical protein
MSLRSIRRGVLAYEDRTGEGLPRTSGLKHVPLHKVRNIVLGVNFLEARASFDDTNGTAT